MSHQISPSILNSDFLDLGSSIKMLNDSQADLIHLDIMDGVFVPNLSFGFPIISQIKTAAKKPLDVHLMIIADLKSTLIKIRELGMKASVSVKPATPVDVLSPYLNILDMVLIMSVEPGYGGQSFMESSYDRVKELKKMILDAGTNTLIEVDGGVSLNNLGSLRDAGVDVFVVGTSIFKADDPKEMIEKLTNI
jgi:ribulose-phosphate 3-epimerase